MTQSSLLSKTDEDAAEVPLPSEPRRTGWNLTTVEDPGGVADLLQHTLERVRPRDFGLDPSCEPLAEDGGVITAWIVFEAEVGRGRGLLRLVSGEVGERSLVG